MSKKDNNTIKPDISWLNTIQEQEGIMSDTSLYLKSLSRSFFATGNEKIGNDLDIIAGRISNAQSVISKSIGKMLSDQVNADQKELGKILSAFANKQGGNQ